MSIYDKRILIVDDDPSILNLLEVILSKEGYKNIYKAADGQTAISLNDLHKPDLIVLDVMMPDMDGYEVCKKIRSSSMGHIIFLSAKSEESDKLISYAIGGDEYIVKPFSPKELVAKIKAILNRQEYYKSNRVTNKDNDYSFGNFILNRRKKVLQTDSDDIMLTAKEYLLLDYLIENEGITLSKEQILENVWGIDFDGYDNTVMVHIRHLREKIETDPGEPQFIKTIKGRGYIFENII